MKSDTADYSHSIDARLGALVWPIAAVLLAVHIGLAWGGREVGLLTAQDDARYMFLARSLRAFTYRDLYLVGEPLHGVYPPGYPLFLAIWGAIAGDGFTRLLLPNILLSTAALGLVFASLRRIWSPTGALVSLACLVVNPHLTARAGSVRSEPLYMFLALLCLWALTRAGSDPRYRTALRWTLLAAGTAIAAALTRMIGVSLVAAVGMAWLLERRYRAVAGLGVASLVTIGAWLAWSVLSPGQFEGFHYFADATRVDSGGLLQELIGRVTQLAPVYAGRGLPFMLPLPLVQGTPVDNLFWAVVVMLGVLAGLVELFRRWPAAAWYLPLYGLVLVAWPYEIGRFLEPVLPLLLPTILLGLAFVARPLRGRWSLVVMFAMGVSILVPATRQSWRNVAVRQACEEFSLTDPPSCIESDRRSYLRALAYIDRRTPSDAIFLAAKPEALHYYTGRRAVLLESTLVAGPERFVPELEALGVDYVILGSVHRNELGPLRDRLEANCGRLRLVASFPPRTYLLRLSDPARAVPDPDSSEPDACAAIAAHARANRNADFNETWRAR